MERVELEAERDRLLWEAARLDVRIRRVRAPVTIDDAPPEEAEAIDRRFRETYADDPEAVPHLLYRFAGPGRARPFPDGYLDGRACLLRGRVVFGLETFRRFILRATSVEIPPDRLAARLTQLGFERRELAGRVEGLDHTGEFWLDSQGRLS